MEKWTIQCKGCSIDRKEGFEHEGSGTMTAKTFMPGESNKFSFGVSVGNYGEFDTPLDNYETEAIICSIYTTGTYSCKGALYQTQFKIKTKVIE